MPFARLAPVEPLPPVRGPLRRRPWLLALSLLLHVLLVVLFVLLARRPEGMQGGEPPSYQLMFEPGPPGGQQAGKPDNEEPPANTAPPPSPQPPVPDPLPGPPTPSPDSPPVPDAPVEPPAPTLPPAPEPAPPAPSPELVPTPAPEPAPVPAPQTPQAAAPELPVTPDPSPVPAAKPDPAPFNPQIRITPPTEEEAPARPAQREFVPPQAPTPLPPAPPRPRPAPPPPPQAGTFANPMDLSFGPASPRLAAPRQSAPRGSVASRSLDLSVGVPREGPIRGDQFADARAKAVGADWNRGLLAYWLQHRFYPRQAAESGQDGSVDVELTVNRAGRVIDVQVTSRSGSPFLDLAGLATWRNAQLQPLPREITEEPYKFGLTLHYILVR